MLVPLALVAAAAQMAASSSPRQEDFSRSYVVWIATDGERCSFFTTDTGENADQLTETLRQNYDVTARIEILTDSDTPRRCIAQAKKAVKHAGFLLVRVRRGTDADRSPGIP